MRVLLTGANGQMGWDLAKLAVKKGFGILALDRATLDLTDASAIDREVSGSGASVVVNAAAYTAVDQAESEPELAFAVNRDGPGHLASACAETGIPLIHISTDFVFNGQKHDPYLETDQTSPLNVYGQSKVAGEVVVGERLREHIILRTSWVYGAHGHNFVNTMLRLGQEKEVVRVVDDQHGCPTNAVDIAEAILTIAGQIMKGRGINWGTYHYCGKGVTSWHGFTEAIFALAAQYTSLKVKRVEPISTAEYPTPAKRPANSVLDCSLLEKEFGIRSRPWSESLAHMLEVLFSVENQRTPRKS